MGIVDFHNHLMPGVDDGAQNIEDARRGLTAFAGDGVAVVIVTPHLDGSLTQKPSELAVRLKQLDAAWSNLSACAQNMGVRVERGVELLLNVPEPDISDPRVRLAGGRFVLVEFPFMMIPPQSAAAIKTIRDNGYLPVIAHPERYAGVENRLDLLADWKDSGGYLQVNGPSLLGRYGETPRTVSFELLTRGWVDFLCSDYHTRGGPLVSDYRGLLEEMDAAEQAYTLTETNPSRLLDGLEPLPVAQLPEQRRSVWNRVAAMFRT